MKFKKIAVIIAAAVMGISFAGCGGKTAGTSAETTSGSSSEVNEQDGGTGQTTPVIEAVNDEFDTSCTSLEFIGKINCGWSLGNTLDATGTGLSSETSWGNPKATPELIQAVKDAGFNAVRVPTTWEKHMDEDWNIDPEWMARVKEIVDYAYDRDMYVILNMHHEEWHYPSEEKKAEVAEGLSAAWTQIAETFKGYDERLIFEGMNEPRLRGTEWEWNGGNDEGRTVVNYYNDVFIDAVRATGGNNEHRFLMICPYAANCGEDALAALEIPDDKNIIVSVHAYIPYGFALAEKGTHLWIEEKAVCTRDIDTLAEVIDRLFISKGIAVIIGETGAMNRPYTVKSDEIPEGTAEAETITKYNEEYRAAWAVYFFSKFREIGVPCFWWDNGSFFSGETFGLLDRWSLEWKYPMVVESVMKGAGVK